MALIARNPDGIYASRCALCGAPLTDPIFATAHFLADPSHDLYRFSVGRLAQSEMRTSAVAGAVAALITGRFQRL